MLEFIVITLIVMPFVAFGAFYSTYSRIFELDQRCEQTHHDIDIQLHCRHELIPKLVAATIGFVDHENGVLRSVVDARMSALAALSIDAQMQAEATLGYWIGRLLNLVEECPDLKASGQFATLAAELSNCENKIAASRRVNNQTIAEYNSVVCQFPECKVAPMFSMHVREILNMTSERGCFEDTPAMKF